MIDWTLITLAVLRFLFRSNSGKQYLLLSSLLNILMCCSLVWAAVVRTVLVLSSHHPLRSVGAILEFVPIRVIFRGWSITVAWKRDSAPNPILIVLCSLGHLMSLLQNRRFSFARLTGCCDLMTTEWCILCIKKPRGEPSLLQIQEPGVNTQNSELYK